MKPYHCRHHDKPRIFLHLVKSDGLKFRRSIKCLEAPNYVWSKMSRVRKCVA